MPLGLFNKGGLFFLLSSFIHSFVHSFIRSLIPICLVTFAIFVLSVQFNFDFFITIANSLMSALDVVYVYMVDVVV